MSKARDFADLLSDGSVLADSDISVSEVTGLQTALDAKSPTASPTFTGTITFPSSQTFDGRDVSVDGAKLDGIEAGATADQTASEILTAVKTVDGASSGLDADLLDGQEGSYYTNYADTAVANIVDSAPGTLNTLNELAAALGDDANFSTTITTSIATKLPLAGGTMTGDISFNSTQLFDGRDVSADGAKLDGIESNADVTDTANVTAAGALMDSEVTNLAQVKAFDSADYATATQGTTADAALARSGGTMTGAINFVSGQTFDGRDVSADGTKLDGIETGATADQTAAEIKTAYESNSNTNAYTDAEKTKLAGIETGATADQTKSDIDALGINAATLDSLDSTQFIRSDADDSVSGNLTFTGTGAIKVPSGTTAQQPSSPSNGMFRYNSDDAQFEGYANGAWGAIAGSGSSSSETEPELQTNRQYWSVDTTVSDQFIGKYIKFQLVPSDITISGTWQAISDATIFVTESTSIDSFGEYLSGTQTVSGNHIFYKTLNILDGSTITVTGTLEGVGESPSVGATGSSTAGLTESEVITIAQQQIDGTFLFETHGGT